MHRFPFLLAVWLCFVFFCSPASLIHAQVGGPAGLADPSIERPSPGVAKAEKKAPAEEKQREKGFSEQQGVEMFFVFVGFVGLFLVGYFFLRKQPNEFKKKRQDKKRKKRFKP